MCKQCGIILKRLNTSLVDTHDYYHALSLLKSMEEQKRIELLARDCLLKDAVEILESEQLYTVCHYIRCKSYETVYFIGACIRGTPVFKKEEHGIPKYINKIIWGNVGPYYKNKS